MISSTDKQFGMTSKEIAKELADQAALRAADQAALRAGRLNKTSEKTAGRDREAMRLRSNSMKDVCDALAEQLGVERVSVEVVGEKETQLQYYKITPKPGFQLHCALYEGVLDCIQPAVSFIPSSNAVSDYISEAGLKALTRKEYESRMLANVKTAEPGTVVSGDSASQTIPENVKVAKLPSPKAIPKGVKFKLPSTQTRLRQKGARETELTPVRKALEDLKGKAYQPKWDNAGVSPLSIFCMGGKVPRTIKLIRKLFKDHREYNQELMSEVKVLLSGTLKRGCLTRRSKTREFYKEQLSALEAVHTSEATHESTV